MTEAEREAIFASNPDDQRVTYQERHMAQCHGGLQRMYVLSTGIDATDDGHVKPRMHANEVEIAALSDAVAIMVSWTDREKGDD